MTQCFAIAERIHIAMSRQSAESDLAAIAQLRPGECVQIRPETHAVLSLALSIAEDTHGLFDPVAPGSASREADWRDVSVSHDGLACVRRALHLSLDGIAKGWAADQLCAFLRDEGAREAIIDAGGDLALACETPQAIGVRDPRRPHVMARTLQLAVGGVASSGGYGGISELWNGVDPLRSWPRAVTVAAPSCAVADALTKVAALDPEATDILARWSATAFTMHAEHAA
jgi:thiamine biosynthesis lipoprotein